MLSRLTMNASQSCNLRCIYCYASGGSYSGAPRHMKPGTALSVLAEVASAHSRIDFIQFIGGEPLLNSPLLHAVVAEVDRLVTVGRLSRRPGFGLATNLTLLTEADLELFRKNGFHLTVSLDGPEEVHDSLRGTRGGEGTHCKVIRNIRRLEDVNVSYDIECTYTYRHQLTGLSVLDLLHYFSSETRAGEYGIVMVSTGPGDVIGFNNHADWRVPVQSQLEAIAYSLDCLERGVLVPYGLFLDILRQVQSPGTTRYCPAGATNLAIASDGTYYQCHMFTNNPTYVVSVDAIGGRFDKTTSDLCLQCWARPWCRACIGNMEIRSPSRPAPYPLHCETQRGGLSLVLNRLSAGVTRACDEDRLALLPEPEGEQGGVVEDDAGAVHPGQPPPLTRLCMDDLR
jgi:uncharacterized protein